MMQCMLKLDVPIATLGGLPSGKLDKCFQVVSQSN